MSKADLVSKWGHQADGGSGTGNVGEGFMVPVKTMDNGGKRNGVKEVTDLDTDEVFMEIEDGKFEQVQVGGNRKRVRNEDKGGVGLSYNMEDVD